MPRKMIVAVSACAIAISGLFVAAQSATASSGRRAAPQAAPPGLDHFVCYNATQSVGTKPRFKVPAGVTLMNQFSPAPFKPTFRAIDLHCNPAEKIVPAAAFPPQSPSWHLMCYAIAAKQAPNTHLVKVTNQFGSARLKTGAPNQFCLPSLKSTQTPPVFNPPGPNEIQPDHFTCYPVTLTKGAFRPPAPVMVRDQFTQTPVVVQVAKPTELCVPTQKMIDGAVKAQITNPAAHLLCFQISKTPFINPIWDRNQFGTGQLTITNTSTLCLPSFKQLIK